jgi:Domain of unknown function (DUF4124)
MTRILIAVLFVFPLLAVGQIYKTTDGKGNVVFTDKPPASSGSSERIELSPINSSAPPPEISRPAAPMDLEAQAEPISYTVEILSPPTETTIPMGPGNFSLSASVAPQPQAGETLQLNVDGSPWGDPQSSSSWQLTNVFRGAHDLTVSVIDADGATLASSEPVRVYVLRPSINNRNRR